MIALSSALFQSDLLFRCGDTVKGRAGLGSQRCQLPERAGDFQCLPFSCGMRTGLHNCNCTQPPIYLFGFFFSFFQRTP